MYFVSLHYSSSINYKHEGARSEQAICSTLHLGVSYDVIAVLYAAYCPPATLLCQNQPFIFVFPFISQSLNTGIMYLYHTHFSC